MSASKAAKSDGKMELRIPEEPKKSREKTLAELAISPAVNAAATVVLFGKGTMDNLEITETLEAVSENAAKVCKGDMTGPEQILVTQATALNSIFTELARRSGLNMGEYIEASERYMRLALKAQAQCRATIETLAAMKNPPVVFARQANISNGPQQVNNGGAPSRAENSDIWPNELLEHRVEQRLDFGAAGTPGGSNPALVAVEASHRA